VPAVGPGAEPHRHVSRPSGRGLNPATERARRGSETKSQCVRSGGGRTSADLVDSAANRECLNRLSSDKGDTSWATTLNERRRVGSKAIEEACRGVRQVRQARAERTTSTPLLKVLRHVCCVHAERERGCEAEVGPFSRERLLPLGPRAGVAVPAIRDIQGRGRLATLWLEKASGGSI
jgi:hypothetical protein